MTLLGYRKNLRLSPVRDHRSPKQLITREGDRDQHLLESLRLVPLRSQVAARSFA
jgi:hypothetical protein